MTMLTVEKENISPRLLGTVYTGCAHASFPQSKNTISVLTVLECWPRMEKINKSEFDGRRMYALSFVCLSSSALLA